MKARNLVIGLFTSMIALSVFSITASLAWYSGATKLSIDNLNIVIGAEPDLSVSFSSTGEDEKWETGNKISKNISDYPLIPVSSVYSNEWTKEKTNASPFFYDSYNGILIKDSDTGEMYRPSVAETGYYTGDLYLYSNSNAYVSLDPEKTKVSTSHEENLRIAQTIKRDKFNEGLTDEELATKMDDYVNCLRVSFLDSDPDTYNYSIIDPNKGEKKTYYGGILDTDRDGYFDTFQSTKDKLVKQTVYGDVQNLDKAVYSSPLTEDKDYTGSESSFNAKSAKGSCCFDQEASLENGLTITEEPSLGLNQKDLEKLLIPVKAYQPKKIVVSIYAEGWDESSVNDTMGANFDFNLSFNIARER